MRGVAFIASGSGTVLQTTSHTVALAAGHGTPTTTGSMQFRYMPKSGRKGTDGYAGRICGKSSSGTGRSTITYTVTIE